MCAAVFTMACKMETNSAPETFSVKFDAKEHGALIAKVRGKQINADTKQEKGTIAEFSATLKDGYALDKRTITGSEFENDAGTDGIYYIKVTGLTAADLEGSFSFGVEEPSALGKILNDNQTKKVALKLEEVSCLTSMHYCFSDCTNLTQMLAIPNGVTDMFFCFSGCKKISSVTLKCKYVEYMFHAAFKNCKKLTQNSITVPQEQLQTYKDNASWMGAEADWFIGE